MKCQILFSGENKKNTMNLLSSELAQRKVRINTTPKHSIGNYTEKISILI